MKRFVAVVFLLAVAVTAQAGLDRTAVSLYGSDANPCSLTAPCATFAKAISETNPLGELIALDSGGYDGFTVDRAMTITVAPGVVVTVGQEPGVTNWAIKVNAPGKRVSLRGLMVVTKGSAMGIVAHDAAATYIDDVVIEGSACEIGCGTAIFGRRGDLFVNHARIRNVFQGINHNPLEPSTATITNTTVDQAELTGIGIDNYAKGVIRNTVVTRSGKAFSTGALTKGAKPEMTLVDCMATSSTTGVMVGNASNVHMERTAVSRNVTGVWNSGGTIFTHGNNMVSGNGTDVSGVVTAAGLI
ncbi:MAG TPA: right-handed parallel beta-helix repeat-containing protein [Thermoanaerobaculia bacterium]